MRKSCRKPNMDGGFPNKAKYKMWQRETYTSHRRFLSFHNTLNRPSTQNFISSFFTLSSPWSSLSHPSKPHAWLKAPALSKISLPLKASLLAQKIYPNLGDSTTQAWVCCLICVFWFFQFLRQQLFIYLFIFGKMNYSFQMALGIWFVPVCIYVCNTIIPHISRHKEFTL